MVIFHSYVKLPDGNTIHSNCISFSYIFMTYLYHPTVSENKPFVNWVEACVTGTICLRSLAAMEEYSGHSSNSHWLFSNHPSFFLEGKPMLKKWVPNLKNTRNEKQKTYSVDVEKPLGICPVSEICT